MVFKPSARPTTALGSSCRFETLMGTSLKYWRSTKRPSHRERQIVSQTDSAAIFMSGLLAKAMLAFLVLPGMVAFVVPFWLLAPGGPSSFVDALGLIPLGVGIVLLLWCVREFYVAGRGTLA